jgi:hypothetical protein
MAEEGEPSPEDIFSVIAINAAFSGIESKKDQMGVLGWGSERFDTALRWVNDHAGEVLGGPLAQALSFLQAVVELLPPLEDPAVVAAMPELLHEAQLAGEDVAEGLKLFKRSSVAQFYLGDQAEFFRHRQAQQLGPDGLAADLFALVSVVYFSNAQAASAGELIGRSGLGPDQFARAVEFLMIDRFMTGEPHRPRLVDRVTEVVIAICGGPQLPMGELDEAAKSHIAVLAEEMKLTELFPERFGLEIMYFFEQNDLVTDRLRAAVDQYGTAVLYNAAAARAARTGSPYQMAGPELLRQIELSPEEVTELTGFLAASGLTETARLFHRDEGEGFCG